jgi:acetyl-CoA acetyltransferase
VLNLQLDPYYLAPLGLGPLTTSALQASAYMARSGATDGDFAACAARNRAAAARNPNAQVREAASAAALQQTPWAVEPLREGYVAPVGESAVCLVLAGEGKAEKMCKGRPGSTASTAPSARWAPAISRSASAKRRGEGAGDGRPEERRRGGRRRAQRRDARQEMICAKRSGTGQGDGAGDQSVGRR